MPRTAALSGRKPYGILAFWGIHTLMLALFLILEAAGFKMPVGSSLFYFAWIAVWLMHGLTLVLMHIRDREQSEGDRPPLQAAVGFRGAQCVIYRVWASDTFVVVDGTSAGTSTAGRGTRLVDLSGVVDGVVSSRGLCNAA